jgi:Rnl2 family RNA ligase
MEFKKYPSLININNDKYINKLKNNNCDKLYCLSEKVHGANFTMMVEKKGGGELLFEMAKRTGKLDKNNKKDFFKESVDNVKNKYMKKSFKLFEHLNNNLNNEIDIYKNIKLQDNQYLKSIYIYGELFGGYYPHPDIKNKKSLKIQDGVYYTNENDFYAFDLVLIISDKNDKQDFLWLCPQHINKLFPYFGFNVYAKILHIGTIIELININININSVIPQLFYNMPSLDNNICEGMVMRSYNTSILNKIKKLSILGKTKK